MSKEEAKKTALKYFNHLNEARGWGLEEFEMKKMLEDDNVFSLIETEARERIEEIIKKFPEKRMQEFLVKINESFEENRNEDDEDWDEEEEETGELNFDSVFAKLISEREFDDYDNENEVFMQRLSYDDDSDTISGNPKQIKLDKVIKKLQDIKSKYPDQEIYINTVADGTMAVDRVRVYAVVKKLMPLYEVYNTTYAIANQILQRHEYEVKEFKRKQKELGL